MDHPGNNCIRYQIPSRATLLQREAHLQSRGLSGHPPAWPARFYVGG